jgi:putative glutamine amidotransferase
MLKIGLSACFFHADHQRLLFKGKTLLYMEESMVQWVQKSGALPILIPWVGKNAPMDVRKIVSELDGLLLQGGDDVSPLNYGEEPLQPKWAGDGVRDLYEMALIKEFLRQKKPILGICRGAQILNVALGGSLYQDIPTQVPGALVHRDWHIYDDNLHEVRIAEGSHLAKWLGTSGVVTTTTVHHQAIKELAPGMTIEAISEPDGIVEAIRYQKAPFVFALQWHPEFRRDRENIVDTRPVMEAFLNAARSRSARGSSKPGASRKTGGRKTKGSAPKKLSGRRKSARTRRG